MSRVHGRTKREARLHGLDRIDKYRRYSLVIQELSAFADLSFSFRICADSSFDIDEPSAEANIL